MSKTITPSWLVIDGQPNDEVLHFRAHNVVGYHWDYPRFRESSGDKLSCDSDVANEAKQFVREHGHYGISAPQIGYPERWFYINEDKLDVSEKTHGGVFINPSFRGIGSARWKRESCLSVPNESHRVRRYDVIIAQWRSVKEMPLVIGETCTADHISEPLVYQCRMIGKLAQVFQHEYDHLNGVLINQRKKVTRK